MAGKLGVAGQKPHALFLRLDKQQLVERILVFDRMRKFGRGMTGG